MSLEIMSLEGISKLIIHPLRALLQGAHACLLFRTTGFVCKICGAASAPVCAL